jgi:hypothetical protein
VLGKPRAHVVLGLLAYVLGCSSTHVAH